MSTSGIAYTLVDAFATGPFTGNQAAVVVTQEPLSSDLMLKVAMCVPSVFYLVRFSHMTYLYVFSEFNVASTAFVVSNSTSDPSSYRLRWFTPVHEIKLCGHATLATAHVLSGFPSAANVTSFTFDSLSGPLRALKTEDGMLELDFPADDVVVVQGEAREKIANAVTKAVLGNCQVKEVYSGRSNVAIELTMNECVNLADLQVDHSALVSIHISSFYTCLSHHIARAFWSRRDPHCRNGKFRRATFPFAIPPTGIKLYRG
jgi:predicted PhzF superfamily epimerase YddE/YHI9